YQSGRAAANHNDWHTSLADWRESLRRNYKWFGAIMRRAALHFSPDVLRTQLLPDDPAAWFVATRFIFPDPDDPGRTAWLKTTAERWASGPEPTTVSNFTLWATTLEHLGDNPAAVQVWQRAIERFPDDPILRDRLAMRLETDERYEEAVPLLDWLATRQP